MSRITRTNAALHLGDTDTSSSVDDNASRSGRDSPTDYGFDYTSSYTQEQENETQRSRTLRSTTIRTPLVENRPSLAQKNSRKPNTSQENQARPPRRPQLGPSRQVAPQNKRKQKNPVSQSERLRREIMNLQANPNYLIPRLSFARLVREIIMDFGRIDFRVTIGAMEALQTASEMYITQRFQDAYLLTMHRGRVTLEVRDMVLMAFICSTRFNE